MIMAKKYKAAPEEISFYENDEEFIETPQGVGIEDQSLSFYDDPQNPAQNLQPNGQGANDLPWYQSIPNSILKGVVNGLYSLGESISPPFDGNDPSIPNLKEQFDQLNLPTNEGFAENTFARAATILPFLLTGNVAGVGRSVIPEAKAAGQALAEGMTFSSSPLKQVLLDRAKDLLGPLTRSLVGGASGAAAETYGAPEWAQSLAEIPAQVTPGFGSRLIPNNTQSALVNDARNLGLTEAQITPLIQGSRKARVLSKVASRRGQTEQALSDSYESLGMVYDRLSTRPDAKVPLNPYQTQRVSAAIEEKLSSMPAGVRNKISEDLSDLVNGPMDAQNLINFYKDINYYVGNGERQLGLLKEPITTAIGQISPQLAQEFNVTNRLYQNYHNIAKQLKPNIASDFLSATEGARLLFGAFTGNYPLIVETIGEGAARKLASGLLVNPRFQNLSKQMVKALNDSKFAVAEKVYESMLNYAREEDPESAVYLQKANLRNLGTRSNTAANR